MGFLGCCSALHTSPGYHLLLQFVFFVFFKQTCFPSLLCFLICKQLSFLSALITDASQLKPAAHVKTSISTFWTHICQRPPPFFRACVCVLVCLCVFTLPCPLCLVRSTVEKTLSWIEVFVNTFISVCTSRAGSAR